LAGRSELSTEWAVKRTEWGLAELARPTGFEHADGINIRIPIEAVGGLAALSV
jgi:hypothetical protein